ncbi:MAG: hypothetical protein AABN33_18115, partial [Acidobacteriota bacterium]
FNPLLSDRQRLVGPAWLAGPLSAACDSGLDVSCASSSNLFVIAAMFHAGSGSQVRINCAYVE